MSTHTKALVDPSEVDEIEVVVVRRVRELILGEHRSVFIGMSGVEFANVRAWEPGDPSAKINWPQSLLKNFNPMIVNESAEERTVDLLFVLDASLSVRCGVRGITAAHVIARVLATIGLSATIFQDRVGMMVSGTGEEEIDHAPRLGREYVWGLVDAYAEVVGGTFPHPTRRFSLTDAVLGMTVRPAMIICISDFLDEHASKLIEEASFLGGEHHDVFLVMVDSAFAFDVPPVSSGWIECCDVERGNTLLLSSKQIRRIPGLAKAKQDAIQKRSNQYGVDCVRVHPEQEGWREDLIDFFFVRRLNSQNLT